MAKNDYKWLFDLVEYTMTKDVKEDYMASVKTMRSLTVEDIAKAIAAERTEYRVETLVNIVELIDQKIRQMVCQGNTVVTGTAVFSPSITGLFIGKNGTVNPEVNRCVINVSPSSLLRAEVAKVVPEFSGFVKELGGAYIGLVKDVTTGATDGTVTPGGMVDVTGVKIRCVNADGSGIGSVQLLNAETQAVVETITSLGINDPSRLLFNIPASLAAGEYRLVVETWFSNNTTLLKEPRRLEYAQLLKVVAAGE